jgi:hypothetical protein
MTRTPLNPLQLREGERRSGVGIGEPGLPGREGIC